MKYTAATVRHEADTISDFLGVYRLVRDVCARGGLPDWGEFRFTLECDFQAARVLSPKEHAALEATLRDLNLGVRLEVREL